MQQALKNAEGAPPSNFRVGLLTLFALQTKVAKLNLPASTKL
jgi:hypothetical protein